MLFDLICRIDIKQSNGKTRLCHYVVANNLPIGASFNLPDNKWWGDNLLHEIKADEKGAEDIAFGVNWEEDW